MLRQLQEDERPWVEHNFPGRESYWPLLAAFEELGELARAHLKTLQGICGSEDAHRLSKIDAVGDVVIALADYCTANNIDMEDAVQRTWAKVKLRDWRKDPVSGGKGNEGDPGDADDPMRGTGRTTALMLHAIASALQQPDEWVQFHDHAKSDIGHQLRHLDAIGHVAAALHLTLDVEIVGSEIRLRSPIRRMRGPR
jgi:NTP pyrophosphatase (non-canonical NTP hydrolase)